MYKLARKKSIEHKANEMSPRKQKRLWKDEGTFPLKKRKRLPVRKKADKTKRRTLTAECERERMEWLQAQYCSCVVTLAWERISKLKNEACYGCSHRKVGKQHH